MTRGVSRLEPEESRRLEGEGRERGSSRKVRERRDSVR
jgi:hypothetical protein